jgi:hypothetical protein
MRPIGCAATRDAAPELALDVLDGAERTEVLHHLAPADGVLAGSGLKGVISRSRGATVVFVDEPTEEWLADHGRRSLRHVRLTPRPARSGRSVCPSGHELHRSLVCSECQTGKVPLHGSDPSLS